MRQLQDRVGELSRHPDVQHAIGIERFNQLLQDAQTGLDGERQLVEQVMERHCRVQEQKKKAVWIERDPTNWTLIPGFGDSEEKPWAYNGEYLHPFRVANAYSFLTDLGRIPRIEVPDAEEE